MRLIASAKPSTSFLRPASYINQTISLVRRRVIHVQRVAALRDLESVCRRGVPAGADRDATLRGMRADAREGNGLCLRPSSTAIGSAAYGHRLHTRQDLSGLVGCFP